MTTTKAPSKLTGKWKVDQLIRNGDTAKANDWLTDSLCCKNIYLEEYGRFTFNPNPYVVETGRATTGIYHYDEPKKTIRLLVNRPNHSPDTVYAVVNLTSAGHMQWKIADPKYTVSLLLTKMPEALHQ